MFAVTPSGVFADSPAPTSAEYTSPKDTSGGVFNDISNWISSIRIPRVYTPPSPSLGSCRQNTDRAHHSSTHPGRVNVHVTARCPTNVAEMYHTAAIMRSNNSGFGYEARPTLTPGRDVFHGFGVRRGTAVANTHCSVHWFRGTGEGYVVYNGFEGTLATAETTGLPAYDPCGLD